MWGKDDQLGHITHYKLNKILLIAKHGFRKSNTYCYLYIIFIGKMHFKCCMVKKWLKSKVNSIIIKDSSSFFSVGIMNSPECENRLLYSVPCTQAQCILPLEDWLTHCNTLRRERLRWLHNFQPCSREPWLQTPGMGIRVVFQCLKGIHLIMVLSLIKYK